MDDLFDENLLKEMDENIDNVTDNKDDFKQLLMEANVKVSQWYSGVSLLINKEIDWKLRIRCAAKCYFCASICFILGLYAGRSAHLSSI